MKIDSPKSTPAPAASKPAAAPAAAKPAAAPAETKKPIGILATKTDFSQAKAQPLAASNTAAKLAGPQTSKAGLENFQAAALGAGAVGGAQAAAQTVNQQKVDQATTQVQQVLSRHGGEFPAIQNAMKDLNPAEFNSVLHNMSADQMRDLTIQCRDANLSGSMSNQQAYNFIASKADASNLSRMMPNLESPQNAQQLGQAIAQNASATVKEQFVSQNKGLLTNEDHALNSTMAIGEVLGGLKNNPANLERALNDLGPANRQTLIDNSTNYASWGGGDAALGPLSRTMDAVASLPGNAQMKAQMFMGASNSLAPIEGYNGVSGQELRGNLTKILQSDVNGVMGSLENMDRNGTSLVPQLKSMMQNGQTQPISDIMAKMLKGNDLQGDPMARFGASVQEGGGPHYDNAENLGYLYGAIYSATKGAVNDVNQQADLLKHVVDGASALGGMIPGAGTAAGIGGTLGSKAVDWWANQIKQGYEGFKSAMQQASFPSDASGRYYEGPGEGAYDSAISRFHD